jgi:acetylornithine deacetylase
MRDVVSLTKALCAIESTTGNEQQVVDFVANLLASNGFTVERQTLPGSNRSNLYAFCADNPKILLTTHLDTVPPHIPVRLSDDGEWLIGRGVCDAKGIAAAIICAALDLKDPRVALLFVVGEETVSDGAKWAAKEFKRSFDFIIDGEPTDLKLASSMKGALVFELSASGKAGHSAYPQTGHSAVHQLVHDAANILGYAWPDSPVFGDTTVNIGVIKGGQAPNVIAADAYLNGVMRLSYGADEAEQQLRQLINPWTTLKILSKSAPRRLHVVEGFETCQVAFGCDIPHLEKLGTPLLFGPGSILEAHTSGEKIRIKDLADAVLAYQRLCRSLLGV